MWPQARAQQLTQLTAAAFSKPQMRFAVIPSFECDFISYFPEDFAADCQAVIDPSMQYVPKSQGLGGVDAIILTAHGADLSAAIWDLRQKIHTNTLIVVWLWDNHLAHLTNLRASMAGDYVFPSHKYIAGYLINPASVLGTHIPACSGQWTREESARYFEQFIDIPRSGRLFVNYVDYPFSPRSQLLRQLKAEVAEANVLLMEPNERSRYFGKPRAERFREWVEHKSTLILPVDRDLSTRVFDALLAGQVLLVPTAIADFDEVIPPAIQSQLGIIRLPNLDIPAIRQAAIQAEKTYDAMGIDGVRARHRYILDNHMMVHRVRDMLLNLKAVASRQLGVAFGGNAQIPFGLHLIRPQVG